MSQFPTPFPFPGLPVFSPATFWQGFGIFAQAMEPIVRHAAKTNLEMMAFAANRTRAAMELPQALARCRTPQDVFAAQSRYVEKAREEYVGAAQRIGTAWQGALGQAAGLARAAAEPRDYMDLLEASKPDAASAVKRPEAADRRAA